MEVFQTTIENGKIQIPPQVLEQLDFENGQELEIEIEKRALRVSLSAAERIKRAQAKVRKYVPENVSMADELIVDRKREAEND